MSSTRLWILLLALTSFLAGAAGGLLAGSRLAPPPAEAGPFSDYAALLVARFDLEPDRERRLKAVLELYHRDLEELKSRHVAEAEPELIRLGESCRQRIRDYVLPPGQQSVFDQEGGLSSPDESVSWAAPSAPGR
jgi:hypothetical protein